MPGIIDTQNIFENSELNQGAFDKAFPKSKARDKRINEYTSGSIYDIGAEATELETVREADRARPNDEEFKNKTAETEK